MYAMVVRILVDILYLTFERQIITYNNAAVCGSFMFFAYRPILSSWRVPAANKVELMDKHYIQNRYNGLMKGHSFSGVSLSCN